MICEYAKRKIMKLTGHVCGSVLPMLVVVILSQTVCGQGTLDLNLWSQEGAPAAGNWTVSADGSNVFQSINVRAHLFCQP